MKKESIDQLDRFTQQIGKAIGLQIDTNNGDEVKGKLDSLITLLPVSAHCVALSEMLYSEKLGELIEGNAYASLGATDRKILINSKANKEIYYQSLCDRQNRGLTHAIEGLRSVLSYLKNEMQHLN